MADKRVVLILKKISGVETQIGIRKVKPTDKFIKIKSGNEEHQIPFSTKRPALRIRNKWLYFLDIDEGQVLMDEKKMDHPGVSTDLIDAILAKGTIKRIVSAMEKPPVMSQYIIYMLIGGIIGWLAGIIVGQIIHF